MMKILLISGHGAGDSGAVGNGYREADLTRELVNLIAPDLKEYEDVSVSVYDQRRNAYADAQKYLLKPGRFDYAFEVHFNAGGGHGTEIHITTNEASDSVEKKILDRLKKFFTNRGVKRTNFSVITTLKNQGTPSALLETCFIDSAEDMKEYQKNKSKIAEAIADGIADGFGLKKKAVIEPGWKQYGSKYKYVCKDGSFKKNGWLKLEDGSYLFDSDGWMLTGFQTTGNGNSFYLDENGRCAKNCTLTVEADSGGRLKVIK